MASPQHGNSQHATRATPLSQWNLVDGLQEGTQWSNGNGNSAQPVVLTYSFPWSNGAAIFASNYSSLNEPSQGYALSTAQQNAVRQALQAWSSVANIQFMEVQESATNVGDLRFGWTQKQQGSNIAAWAYTPSDWWANAGDVWLAESTMSRYTDMADWLPGGAAYSVLLHEIGHSLGLKHPFDGTPVLDQPYDSKQYTVMSYTEHPNGLGGAPSGANNYQYHSIQPETPMLLDIAAIQHMYGANQDSHGGNDTYTIPFGAAVMRTLWDTGGEDTIDASALTQNAVIDLRPGGLSSLPTLPPAPSWAPLFNYGANNLVIALGTTIENAKGGAGNDTLIGNEANNRLQGHAGDDRIDGMDGLDTAVYAHARSSYQVLRLDDGNLSVRSTAEGSDTLLHIERLRFADSGLAFDLNATAGTAAKIVGAVLGAPVVQNQGLMGAALHLLDTGMTARTLAQTALNLQLGQGYTAAQAIDLLYRNLTLQTQTPDDLLHNLQADITQGKFDTAGLALIVADMPENGLRIGLAGLVAGGLGYA